MSDMISRDVVLAKIHWLSSADWTKAERRAADAISEAIRAIPAVDARAEALKEAVKACKAVADELREDNDAEAVGALECALRLTALISETKP